MADAHLPPAPQANETRLKPGIGWYLAGGGILGGALIVAGGLFFYGLVFEFIGAFDDMPRASVTEQTELELEAGEQVVYLVGPGTDESTAFGAEDLEITDPDGLTQAVLTRSDPPLATGEDVYTPRLEFVAEQDGTYGFSPSPDADRSGEIDELAVGPDGEQLIEGIVPWVLGALVVGLLGTIVGTVLLIVTGVRRRKNKRAQALGGPTYGQPVQPQPTPGSWAAPSTSAPGSAPDDDPWRAPGAGPPRSGWS